MGKMRIGVLTGGGDAPGLNAVIYGLTRSVLNRFPGTEIIGYKFGYRGLYKNEFIPLTRETTSGILRLGGSMLYSSNKDNLFNYIVGTDDSGKYIYEDVSDVAVENLKKENVDVLVVLGGDGTLTSARDFSNKGVNVIGIPKTIDNDLSSTDVTFGFDTAVNIAAENLGRLHTTAESHHRVLIAEIMGRNAGWLPLYAGIAGSADIILLPEFPFSFQKVIDKIKERDAAGRPFTIIAVGEGAHPAGGDPIVAKIVADSPDAIRLGGIAKFVADNLEKSIDHEIRYCVFGHIQRGGDSSPADRNLSLRYAVGAVDLIERKEYGRMVCIKNGKIGSVPLNEVITEDVAARQAKVTKDDEMLRVAQSIGISFGTEEI
jgi:6-phosphofructokinase 1